MEHTIAHRALGVLLFRANRLLDRAKPSQKGEATLIRSTHKDSATHGWNSYLPGTNQGNCRGFSLVAGLATRIRRSRQAMGYPWRADMDFSPMQKSVMAAMSLTALSEGRAIVKDSPLFTHSTAKLVFLT